MALSEEIVTKARAANPGRRIIELSAGGMDFLVRSPGRAEYQKFKADGADPQTQTIALESLVRDVILIPTPAEFDKLLEDMPALADALGVKVLEAAGMHRVTEGKGR